MGVEMTNIQLFYIQYMGGWAFIKRQRYFAEIHLSRGVLVLIKQENRGVTVACLRILMLLISVFLNQK